jgi:flagellar biosynthesis anti-sigma factor FlgM
MDVTLKMLPYGPASAPVGELAHRARWWTSMRINDSNSLGSSVPAQTGKTGQVTSGSRNGSGASRSATGDSVEISGFTGRISEALQAADSSRSAKVSRISAEISSGTYKVDAMAVSSALVDRAISDSSSA